ncbi:23S rRNA (pseudouridine(1915)-N(3))-methyltransferase RlmH [Mycoplasma sp. 'Moose RK']|uniref:23S rRNA (pseudouridine(1915)-N(3))-methyltransferase RlmH n=1 Tax=Mycoplasma sp. 'Moose RK' TaxID=2780095 RepID=UPI0018C28B36|nr:23S rRNA (pseudouridine(1915)-N(3))-methyltransferase RlmH [Mycoplasma sp. 'Moose RK']MBG0730516.1 23S rRNA (pseudouridine(1915)-N(3))-methyltransferase RlmH [Mycoplasma sp. 'Moose RK']
MRILILHFGINSRDYLPLYKKEINKIKEFNYNVDFLNLPEFASENLKLKKSVETEKILAKIPKNFTCYLFTDRGKMISSEDFATFFDSANICFIIGGSQGVDEEKIRLKKPEIKFLSLGKIIFPHKIFKLVVLEQIYRGLSIKFNRKYHHKD